jgi:thiazole biosynthesis enzyme
MLDEVKISRAIIESFTRDLLQSLESDVVICGAGPAGLCAAYFLGEEGYKVVVFERTLRPGGGMPGGGMMFNKIVVQEEAKHLLDKWGIDTVRYKENYFVASSLETLGMLLSQAIKRGAQIFNGISVEDVLIIDEEIRGVVINWSAAEAARLHVDPLTAKSSFVVDATGHAAEIARVVSEKAGTRLMTPSGEIAGERPMWAEKGERVLFENTKEIYPNLFVCGMAANAVFGGPRMGPIFGGMLLSGQRVAQLIAGKLGKK